MVAPSLVGHCMPNTVTDSSPHTSALRPRPALAPVLLLAVACSAPDAPRSTPGLPPSETSVAAQAHPERASVDGLDWSDFTLGPSDLVYLTVYGQPELCSPPTGVRVAPDGTLSIPFCGGVTVAGLSLNEAAAAIEAGLSQFVREPAVSLSLIEYASRRFTIFGEVKNTGSYTMDRPLTAIEALALGGGLLPGANRLRSFLIRRRGAGKMEVLAFNAETPGPDGLVQVRPGDLLFVQKSGVGTFSESVVPYLQGMGLTLSQIASLALAYDRLYNE